ncbi:MAG: RNA polymerase factor sigma-54 [bacterium]
MAIELKQSLKLAQQLLITPQLQQAIKLLQLSRTELIETVQKELMENPVLEEAPDSDSPERTETDLQAEQGEILPSHSEVTEKGDNSALSSQDFDWSRFVESYTLGGNQREPRSFAGNDEAPNYENMVSSQTSLHDHLEWQVKMGSLTPEEEEACITIIGNLDDNGYLQIDLQELTTKTAHSYDSLEDALCIIQEMDPPGVGATNLKECLLIQVKEYGPDKGILSEIVNKHLNLIEKRNFSALSKKLGLTNKKTRELANIIYSLEPKPGRSFSTGQVHYITPDVYVQEVGDEFVVILNEDGLPKLQISNLYKTAIMQEKADQNKAKTNNLNSEAQNYIQEKLKSALWLIKSIHQRQKTLYKVTKSIVKFQREFMEHGVQQLKPLVLRDVAEEIGVHESTVSRATNGKYVHSPQGIFELKYFFNTGLSNATGGEDFANEAVKQMIKQFINVEDSKHPLSDQALANMLTAQNIEIARRTVAKYRELMGILPSSRRKRMS